MHTCTHTHTHSSHILIILLLLFCVFHYIATNVAICTHIFLKFSNCHKVAKGQSFLADSQEKSINWLHWKLREVRVYSEEVWRSCTIFSSKTSSVVLEASSSECLFSLHPGSLTSKSLGLLELSPRQWLDGHSGINWLLDQGKTEACLLHHQCHTGKSSISVEQRLNVLQDKGLGHCTQETD